MLQLASMARATMRHEVVTSLLDYSLDFSATLLIGGLHLRILPLRNLLLCLPFSGRITRPGIPIARHCEPPLRPFHHCTAIDLHDLFFAASENVTGMATRIRCSVDPDIPFHSVKELLSHGCVFVLPQVHRDPRSRRYRHCLTIVTPLSLVTRVGVVDV